MKPTAKKKTTAFGRKMAKELRAAMPLVAESPFNALPLQYFTCHILEDMGADGETRVFYRTVFGLWGDFRTFEDGVSRRLAYGRRIMALELAALLAEDGFTAEDFQ